MICLLVTRISESQKALMKILRTKGP